MFPRFLSLLGLAALVTAADALLGGCVPVQQLDASPVTGRVVDRATGRPIANAQVVLTAQPGQEARTQTDQDGCFQLAGLRHLHLVVLPYEMYRAPNGFLRVSVAGYRAYAKNEFFRNEDGSPGYLDHGTKQEVRVALVHAGNRPRPTHGDDGQPPIPPSNRDRR